MYTTLNQYHVVMEAAPPYWQNPEFLHEVYVQSPSGQEVPLDAIAQITKMTAPAGRSPSRIISGHLLSRSTCNRSLAR